MDASDKVKTGDACDQTTELTVLKTDEFTVCPQCFKQADKATSMGREKIDRYKIKRRTYFCHCLDCNLSSEVVQYNKEGKWYIQKSRTWQPLPVTPPTYDPQWWDMHEQPPIPLAALITGPGGDFNKHHCLEYQAKDKELAQLKNLFRNTFNIMHAATQTMGNLFAMLNKK